MRARFSNANSARRSGEPGLEFQRHLRDLGMRAQEGLVELPICARDSLLVDRDREPGQRPALRYEERRASSPRSATSAAPASKRSREQAIGVALEEVR
jgi:hypothetical protein